MEAEASSAPRCARTARAAVEHAAAACVLRAPPLSALSGLKAPAEHPRVRFKGKLDIAAAGGPRVNQPNEPGAANFDF